MRQDAQSDHSSPVRCPRHLAMLTLWLQQGTRHHEWILSLWHFGESIQGEDNSVHSCSDVWTGVSVYVLNWSHVHRCISVGELSHFTMERGGNFRLLPLWSGLKERAQSHLSEQSSDTAWRSNVQQHEPGCRRKHQAYVSTLTCTTTRGNSSQYDTAVYWKHVF